MVCGFSHPYLLAPVRGGGAGVCLLSEPAPPHMAPPGSGNGGGMRRPAHGAAGLLSRYDRYGQQPGAGGPVYRGLSHPDRHLLVCLPGELLDRAVCGLLRLHRPGPGRDAEDGAQADPCRQRAVPGPPGYPGGRPAGILWLLCRTVFHLPPLYPEPGGKLRQPGKGGILLCGALVLPGHGPAGPGQPGPEPDRRVRGGPIPDPVRSIHPAAPVRRHGVGAAQPQRGRHAGAGPPATRAVPPVQGKHGSGQRKIPRPEKSAGELSGPRFPGADRRAEGENRGV